MDCAYNPAVTCEQKSCASCGWNPAVEKRRKNRNKALRDISDRKSIIALGSFIRDGVVIPEKMELARTPNGYIMVIRENGSLLIPEERLRKVVK